MAGLMQETESTGGLQMGWHLCLSKSVARMMSSAQEDSLREVLELLRSQEFVQEGVNVSLEGEMKDPGWQEALCTKVLDFVLQIPDSDLLELAIPKVKERNGMGPRVALLLPHRHPQVYRDHHRSVAAERAKPADFVHCYVTEGCRTAMRNFLLQVRGMPPPSFLSDSAPNIAVVTSLLILQRLGGLDLWPELIPHATAGNDHGCSLDSSQDKWS